MVLCEAKLRPAAVVVLQRVRLTLTEAVETRSRPQKVKPLQQAVEEKGAPAQLVVHNEEVSRHVSTTNTHGYPTILMVEDNSAILELFATVLTDAGYYVYKASSVEEALRIGLHQAVNLDLLLTDVLLPNAANLQLKRGPTYGKGSTGLDLFRQLRGKRPNVRVLFMSGQTEDQLKALGLTGDRYTLLRKPLMPETLVKAVHSALEHPQPV